MQKRWGMGGGGDSIDSLGYLTAHIIFILSLQRSSYRKFYLYVYSWCTMIFDDKIISVFSSSCIVSVFWKQFLQNFANIAIFYTGDVMGIIPPF
jgi:hypothetical protein